VNRGRPTRSARSNPCAVTSGWRRRSPSRAHGPPPSRSAPTPLFQRRALSSLVLSSAPWNRSWMVGCGTRLLGNGHRSGRAHSLECRVCPMTSIRLGQCALNQRTASITNTGTPMATKRSLMVIGASTRRNSCRPGAELIPLREFVVFRLLRVSYRNHTPIPNYLFHRRDQHNLPHYQRS
jgi:hypothetical protein